MSQLDQIHARVAAGERVTPKELVEARAVDELADLEATVAAKRAAREEADARAAAFEEYLARYRARFGEYPALILDAFDAAVAALTGLFDACQNHDDDVFAALAEAAEHRPSRTPHDTLLRRTEGRLGEDPVYPWNLAIEAVERAARARDISPPLGGLPRIGSMIWVDQNGDGSPSSVLRARVIPAESPARAHGEGDPRA